MDPQVPTSFIPKKPLDGGRPYQERGGLGFLFFIALFIFIVSLVAAGGAFVYQGILNTSIADKTASLKKAEGAFDIKTIKNIIKMDSRINNAQALLQNHVAPSAIFAFLGLQTLQNVQFTNFEYTLQSGNTASIVLQGQADNFSTLAQQSDQFGANSLLKNIVFSNIKVSPIGAVTFNLTATVDQALLNYGKNLGNPDAVPNLSLPQATSTQQ